MAMVTGKKPGLNVVGGLVPEEDAWFESRCREVQSAVAGIDDIEPLDSLKLGE